jgi:hypothetical protein
LPGFFQSQDNGIEGEVVAERQRNLARHGVSGQAQQFASVPAGTAETLVKPGGFQPPFVLSVRAKICNSIIHAEAGNKMHTRSMTAAEFKKKWSRYQGKETSACQMA